MSPWHALLHDRINSLACLVPVLSLANQQLCSQVEKFGHGNLFTWAEAGSGGVEMVVVVVSNSGSFLTEELENWEAVLLLLSAVCTSAREAPLMGRISPPCHVFKTLCTS